MKDRETRDPPSQALCVICRLRPQAEKYRPFCSKRCSDVDLHRWLGGVYAIPAEPDEDDEMPNASSAEDAARDKDYE